MMKSDPLKEKYWAMYWDIADSVERQSVAQREVVGCVIVTPAGIILPGWNGTPAGMDNCCEEPHWWDPELQLYRPKTKRGMLHAENNALGKAMQGGICLDGAHLFSTVAPCEPCVRSIIPSGIVCVHYDRPHDDMTGVNVLIACGVAVQTRHR